MQNIHSVHNFVAYAQITLYRSNLRIPSKEREFRSHVRTSCAVCNIFLQNDQKLLSFYSTCSYLANTQRSHRENLYCNLRRNSIQQCHFPKTYSESVAFVVHELILDFLSSTATVLSTDPKWASSLIIELGNIFQVSVLWRGDIYGKCFVQRW